MITTPRASMPTKSRPMAVSSLSRELRLTTSMRTSMTAAAIAAPSRGLKSKATAAAMPGTTPWVKASPKKLMPRRTSHVPTTEHMRPARMPPSSARCWKPSAKGSANHSITGAA
jgi:hypothetical protein